jgi:hypothetical protein
LESLSVGVFELRDFTFLNQVPTTLRALSLGATRSKAPTLSPLSRFRALGKLHLEGQSKDIEVLSELKLLEDVTLRFDFHPLS